MSAVAILIALVLGIAAAFGAGAVSGLRIGKEALGAELAAYMGGFYGLLAGGIAVLATIVILALV